MKSLLRNQALQIGALCLSLVAFVPAIGHAQDRGREARGPEGRFSDHDRQEALGWYRDHQRSLPAGLRERDRMDPGIEARFDIGFTLDRGLRARVHTVPRDLLLRLGPVPRGCRYVFLDGHLVLIDDRYVVRDVIHLGHDHRGPTPMQ